MIELRPYQKELVENIRKSWKKGNKHVIMQLSTGGGKTVIFSYIAQKSAAKGSRILVLTHRDELLSQTSGTLVDFGLSPKLINSKVKHPADGLLFVGMTGTLANRLKKEEWRKWYESIDLVIIDELHEQQFNWIFDNALTKYKFVLGVSATPKRIGNQRQLSDDYDDMVLGPDTQELINMGYLVPDRYFSSPVDLSGVHKKAGEYDTEEMYSRYNKTELYSGVIDNWKRICPNTITIVFCCNIQHSINTCKAFNEAGIKAKFLVSDVANPILEINASKADLSKYNIKKEEYENYISNFTEYSGNRKEIVAQWKRGEFTVLVNAGIATTGFDFPQIETVIMNRATMSDNLLLQCLDSQTEILTNNGWRSYFNIDKNDLVCGYDMNNGYSKYVPILNIVIRQLGDDEKMFGVKNNYVDIRVTGGHRMIIANRTKAKNKNGYSDYRFCEAKNISEDVKDSFIIPVSSKNDNKDSGLSEWDLKLVGIILSDGCIRKDGVLITQSVKNKTIPEIENIINMSGVHYTKKFAKRTHPCFANGSDLYTYYINKENKIMPNKGKKGLLGIWHLLNKEIPNYYDSLSSDDFKHILYGYYIGNGSKTKNISWDRHTYTICVSNIRMANRFQQLMVTNGIKCSLAPNEDSPSKLLHYSIEKTYKSIKVKASDSRQLWGELERKPEEIVWCVENELSTLITRRNGKVSIVGNCVGRGARIYPDKEFFYLLDFGENCSRLGYYRQQREYSLNHEVGKIGQGVPASKECPKCHALVFASSHICKYCGYVFPKSREEKIVELKEVKYSEAVKELKSIADYELYQKSKGYNKHWLFRQIYIKFGKDGLVEYGKAHNMSPKWAYMEMAKYRAQGL